MKRMIDRECLQCSATFQVPCPSSKRKTCSDECSRARKRMPRATRADKGIRRSEWVTLSCATCCKQMAVQPWEADTRRYCSPACRVQPPTCTVDGCDEPTLARKKCRRHYDEWTLDRPGARARHAAYQREYRSKNLERIRANEWRVNLKRKGLTPEEWQETYERQGRGCAICGERESSNGHRLVVDHCHASGAIRGLLCHACNRGIGLLRDDPARLRVAADYLEAHA